MFVKKKHAEACFFMAEAVGFEPTGDFTRHSISSPFGTLEVIEQYYPKLAVFQ